MNKLSVYSMSVKYAVMKYYIEKEKIIDVEAYDRNSNALLLLKIQEM